MHKNRGSSQVCLFKKMIKIQDKPVSAEKKKKDENQHKRFVSNCCQTFTSLFFLLELDSMTF
jgi:hypothetical protein